MNRQWRDARPTTDKVPLPWNNRQTAGPHFSQPLSLYSDGTKEYPSSRLPSSHHKRGLPSHPRGYRSSYPHLSLNFISKDMQKPLLVTVAVLVAVALIIGLSVGLSEADIKYESKTVSGSLVVPEASGFTYSEISSSTAQMTVFNAYVCDQLAANMRPISIENCQITNHQDGSIRFDYTFDVDLAEAALGTVTEKLSQPLTFRDEANENDVTVTVHVSPVVADSSEAQTPSATELQDYSVSGKLTVPNTSGFTYEGLDTAAFTTYVCDQLTNILTSITLRDCTTSGHTAGTNSINLDYSFKTETTAAISNTVISTLSAALTFRNNTDDADVAVTITDNNAPSKVTLQDYLVSGKLTVPETSGFTHTGLEEAAFTTYVCGQLTNRLTSITLRDCTTSSHTAGTNSINLDYSFKTETTAAISNTVISTLSDTLTFRNNNDDDDVDVDVTIPDNNVPSKTALQDYLIAGKLTVPNTSGFTHAELDATAFTTYVCGQLTNILTSITLTDCITTSHTDGDSSESINLDYSFKTAATVDTTNGVITTLSDSLTFRNNAGDADVTVTIPTNNAPSKTELKSYQLSAHLTVPVASGYTFAAVNGIEAQETAFSNYVCGQLDSVLTTVTFVANSCATTNLRDGSISIILDYSFSVSLITPATSQSIVNTLSAAMTFRNNDNTADVQVA